jgi:hypothetical protein
MSRTNAVSPLGGYRATRSTETPTRALSDGQLRLLLRRCFGHVVASCTRCDRAYTITELRSRLAPRRPDTCPECAGDLTSSLLDHLARCREINPPIA